MKTIKGVAAITLISLTIYFQFNVEFIHVDIDVHCCQI